MDEFFPASIFEPVWPELQRFYHASSPAALALQAELLYLPTKLNIAIHARIGDIIPTPLTYFPMCLRSVLTILQASSFHNAVDVWLFSEASLESLEVDLADVAKAFSAFPATLRLDAQRAEPLLAFKYMAEADIFLASDSGLSCAATFMSTKPVVIVASNKRGGHQRAYLGDRHQHILAEDNGTLLTSTMALEKIAVSFSAGRL